VSRYIAGLQPGGKRSRRRETPLQRFGLRDTRTASPAGRVEAPVQRYGSRGREEATRPSEAGESRADIAGAYALGGGVPMGFMDIADSPLRDRYWGDCFPSPTPAESFRSRSSGRGCRSPDSFRPISRRVKQIPPSICPDSVESGGQHRARIRYCQVVCRRRPWSCVRWVPVLLQCSVTRFRYPVHDTRTK